MKKILLLGILLSTLNNFGQTTNNDSKPYIEVVGTAQTEVVPDRIYLSILLSEKTENNNDFSIQIQEEQLKKLVRTNDIENKYLYLSEATSEVIRDKKKEKGIKLTREYILILKNADKVTKVFQELTDLNIKEVSVKKTEYSEIEKVQKEVRENAIKVAKEKAEYLLSAIGEKIGKPLEIKEIEDKFSAKSNSIVEATDDEQSTSFEKIVVKFSYYIKYSIK